VVLGIGVGEQVKGETETEERFQKAAVIAFNDLTGGDAFALGSDGDGGTVSIRARDHEHVVTAQAVVAGKDVRRQVGPRDLAQVERRVGIRPGHTHKDLFVHLAPYRSTSTTRCNRGPA